MRIEDVLEQIELLEGQLFGQDVIWLKYPFNSNINLFLKSLGARFNAENKTWYVYNTPHFRQIFGLTKKYVLSKDVILKISDVNRRELFRLVEQLELKAYSPHTIKTYSLEFAQWLYILKESPAYDINPEQVRSYILYCVRNLKMSESHIHSRLNAIKFYYEKVLHQSSFMVEIPRPKKLYPYRKFLVYQK